MLKYPAYDPETAKELFGVILPGEANSNSNSSSGAAPTVVSPKGRSFHNGRFVQRLRERALAEPNVTVVEGIVSKLLQVRERGCWLWMDGRGCETTTMPAGWYSLILLTHLHQLQNPRNRTRAAA